MAEEGVGLYEMNFVEIEEELSLEIVDKIFKDVCFAYVVVG